MHTGSDACRSERGKEDSLAVVLLGPCLESDFNVLPWGRRGELELEGYVELLLLFWDMYFLPVEFVVTTVARN